MLIDFGAFKGEIGETRRWAWSGELPPLEAGGEEIPFAGPVEVAVEVTATGPGSFWLEGRARGSLVLTCSRCLERFAHPIEVTLAETCKMVAQEGAGGGDWLPVRGEVLDLRPELAREFFAALPMKPLCRPDCPGLCPVCGRPLEAGACGCRREEVDPRLAALRELLRDREDGSR